MRGPLHTSEVDLGLILRAEELGPTASPRLPEHTCALFLFPAVAASFAMPASAQQWTAEPQAVLAVVEDTWTENDRTWVTRLAHAEMLGWASEIPVPMDQATTRRWRELLVDDIRAFLRGLR